MKVLDYKDVMPVSMDNEMVKNVTGRLMIGKEDGAKNFCMRVFEIASGGYTPMHSHDWEHEVFVHSGDGEIFLKDSWYPLSKGFSIFVPPNIEHQFRNTSADLFTFVCLIPAGVPEL